MTVVEWERFRQCSVCFAPLGEPCRVLSGGRVGETYRVRITDEPRDRPHSTRELTAAAARDAEAGRVIR